MRYFVVLAGLPAWLLAAPAAALGQGAIAGLVTDVSSAALPGVAVEAESPALIEKTRRTTTDHAGRYRLDDLRPGVYVVRFTRPGWTSWQQTGVEITGGFTATVNAELGPGPLAAAITVSAATPVIDRHHARREVSLDSEIVRSIPTVRSYNALLVLVPGVLTSSNDTVTTTATTSFPIHGGRVNEGRLSVDGLTIGSPAVGNSATNYVIDVGQSEGITFVTNGLGEAETSGLRLDIVPRSGGNVTHGALFASGTDDALQSKNVSATLRDQGVAGATPLKNVYDVSGTLGGPIRRDRAWYFVNAHAGGSRRDSANVFYNLNAGLADRWLYEPDRSRLSYSDRTFENGSARLTWQLSQRVRVGAFWDAQAICRTCTGATAGAPEPARVSPEAVGVLGRPLHAAQATVRAVLTSRVFLDAGFGGTYFGVGNFEREPNPTRSLVRVAEQCAAGCAANGGIPGLVYRSQDFSEAYTGSYLWKAALTYVTGSHRLSAGYQHTYMTDDRMWMTNDQQLTYRVNNGVPNQLTQSISPWVNDARVAWQAIYLQEQWTRERLTLQGAVRFDRAWSWFPEQRLGPARFLPEPIVFPETRGVDSYTDLTVRAGATYDVGGTGRTVIKAGIGQYLEGAGVIGNYANTNPTLRMPQTTSVFGPSGITRAWVDDNRNFAPDCDLLNPLAQDRRSTGGDRCGVMSNTNFGRPILTNNFDPAILGGWGVRPSDWHLSLTLQRQIGRRSMVDVTYTRRWASGFFVADNLALTAADLTPYSLIAPLDPRLPGGGGYEIEGLFDVVPEKAGQVDNLVTAAGRYGRWRQYFNGLDVTTQIRAGSSLIVVGGLSVGQSVADNCAVRAQLPELATTTTGTSAFGPGLAGSAVTPVSPYCHVAYGVLPQVRGLAWYRVPKIALEISATVQSKPGALLAANYAATNADVAPSLRRELSGSAANVTVNLIEPGTMYGNRLNQLDLRFARTFAIGMSRTRVSVDLYNALNSSAVLTYNQTFVPGGPWLQPLTLLTPRFVRLTAEVTF